jgi:hypothetical protein
VIERVFLDSSVLIRCFAGDDPARALAAARLLDSEAEFVVSTGGIIELVHVLSATHGVANPLPSAPAATGSPPSTSASRRPRSRSARSETRPGGLVVVNSFILRRPRTMEYE